MTTRKSIRMQVWHSGYTCSLRINMQHSDLRNAAAMKARMCTALFDHGLATQAINKLRDDDMFYAMGPRNVKIFNPKDVPTNALVCFNNVVEDSDPTVYRVRVGGITLPVEVPCHPLRSVVEIEQHIRQRIIQYGVTMESKTRFMVLHGKWTMCTPSRRNYKNDVIHVGPAELDETNIIRSACAIQTYFRNHRRHKRALVIQHAACNYIQRKLAGGWVTVE